MNVIEQLVLKLRFSVWARLKANFYPSVNLSYSQFGEDMVIRALTNDIKNGFYVDIGAHHPVFLSNTYHFYLKGWHGINIDAMPGSMDLFQIFRPRDINLELCLSPIENTEVEYYIFDNSAYNTLDSRLAKQAQSLGVKLIEKKILKTTTISECLDLQLSKDLQIDLMTIDVEGLDEAIMMSNDWERYHPKYLVFERLETDLEEINQLPLFQYLAQYGYKLIAKCGPSFILQCEK